MKIGLCGIDVVSSMVVGVGNPSVPSGPASLNFLGATLPNGVALTRGSNGTYFDVSGNMQTAATDVSRFDFQPITHAARGLLLEGARTNVIRNSTMVGGSAGVAPTNWLIPTVTNITPTIIGTGTAQGMTYLDVRYQGTASGSSGLGVYFDGSTPSNSAATGQVWTNSVYMAMIAGTTTGINSIRTGLDENLGGTQLAGYVSADFKGALTSSLVRQPMASATFNQATTDRARPYFSMDWTNGAVIDITLRIAAPQCEQGAFPSSFIPTSTVAATRAADVTLMSSLSTIGYNVAEGTVMSTYELEGITTAAALQHRVLEFNDGTTSNSFGLTAYNPVSTAARAIMTTATVAQADISLGTGIAGGVIYKSAMAYKVNDIAGCLNAGTVGTDAVATIPTTTQLNFGTSAQANRQLFGWLRNVSYYNTRQSNAVLQTITT